MTKDKIHGLARGALVLLAVTISATVLSAPAAFAKYDFKFEFNLNLDEFWPEGCLQAPVLEVETVTVRCAIQYERDHFLIVDTFIGWEWFDKTELVGARVEELATALWMRWVKEEIASDAPGWTELRFSQRATNRMPANKSADSVHCVEYERSFENSGLEGYEGVAFLTRSEWLVCGEYNIAGMDGAAAQFAIVGVKETYAPELGHTPLTDFDRIVEDVLSSFTW